MPNILGHLAEGVAWGTKGLGCSLLVPDPCQARMVWQRGEQLPPVLFPHSTPQPSRVLL